jgi:uncharacterized lipoprotein YajG
MNTRSLVLPLMLLLAACGVPPASRSPDGPAVPLPAQDTCGAGPYASLVGQDATALERVLIMRQVRVIRPGQAVTMDFSAERINFEIDAANRIAVIFCG